MFENVLQKIFGSKHEREVRQLWPVVEEINRHFESYRDLSDEQLAGKTAEFRRRIQEAVGEPEDAAERKRLEREAL
jgi:preprotein translocase subunit SecA